MHPETEEHTRVHVRACKRDTYSAVKLSLKLRVNGGCQQILPRGSAVLPFPTTLYFASLLTCIPRLRRQSRWPPGKCGTWTQRFHARAAATQSSLQTKRTVRMSSGPWLYLRRLSFSLTDTPPPPGGELHVITLPATAEAPVAYEVTVPNKAVIVGVT